MKPGSRIAAGVAAACAAAMLWALPAQAQQPEPMLHEQLIEGVKGLFNRIFGGSAADSPPVSRPAEAPLNTPVAIPAPPAPVEAARGEPVAVAVPAIPAAPSATALTLSRSLHEAVVRGDLEATLKMLEQGTDIEAKDPGSGASPLHYAVMKGRMEIVDLLIARGADVNSRTRNGTTPLHTAALYSRKEVAERLIEKRADINALSVSGATPLTLASAAKNWPIADMLKARGAR